MENKECGMARDLMPLVIDEVASEASREWVTGHVGACDTCRAYMDTLRTDAAPDDAQAAREERAAMDIAAGHLKRKIRFRTLRHVLIGCLIALAVFAAGLLGYDALMKVTQQVDLEAYGISFVELSDSTVEIFADYKGSLISMGTTIQEMLEIDSVTGQRTRVLYVGMERHLLGGQMAWPMQNGPVMMMNKTDFESFDEVRKGTKENYAVLWRKGDAIPKASAAMEEYYFWHNMLEDSYAGMIESSDGKLGFISQSEQSRHMLIRQQMAAIQAVVPEWQPWVGDTPDPLDEATIEWLLEGGE